MEFSNCVIWETNAFDSISSSSVCFMCWVLRTRTLLFSSNVTSTLSDIGEFWGVRKEGFSFEELKCKVHEFKKMDNVVYGQC